jgi:hypothetical protein
MRHQRYQQRSAVDSLNERQIREASAAWSMGGCLALGLWATHNGVKTVQSYGALVRLVRNELQDRNDYSTC